MNRLPMSPAAGALLRALITRAGATRDRILLTDARSTDWRSLTFSGERHELQLRVTGDDAQALARRMCRGLEHAEIGLCGAIVADINVARNEFEHDGSMSLTIEALTVASD